MAKEGEHEGRSQGPLNGSLCVGVAVKVATNPSWRRTSASPLPETLRIKQRVAKQLCGALWRAERTPLTAVLIGTHRPGMVPQWPPLAGAGWATGYRTQGEV